jgi:hypothetical protein
VGTAVDVLPAGVAVGALVAGAAVRAGVAEGLARVAVGAMCGAGPQAAASVTRMRQRLSHRAVLCMIVLPRVPWTGTH